MELKEILEFVGIQRERLYKYYEKVFGADREKYILAKTVKLNEEVGELCNEILHHLCLQRSDKEMDDENLKEEFADVVIVTLLIADSMGVDIRKALENKVERNRGVSNTLKGVDSLSSVSEQILEDIHPLTKIRGFLSLEFKKLDEKYSSVPIGNR